MALTFTASGKGVLAFTSTLKDGSFWYYLALEATSSLDAENRLDAWDNMTFLDSGKFYYGLTFNFSIRPSVTQKFTSAEFSNYLSTH